MIWCAAQRTCYHSSYWWNYKVLVVFLSRDYFLLRAEISHLKGGGVEGEVSGAENALFALWLFLWGKKGEIPWSLFSICWLMNLVHYFISLLHPHYVKFEIWIVFWCHWIIRYRSNNLDLYQGVSISNIYRGTGYPDLRFFIVFQVSSEMFILQWLPSRSFPVHWSFCHHCSAL